METVPELLAQSGDLFEGVNEALEIDCSGIEHADSAAVALMLEWLRRATAAGTGIRFRAVPERMRAIVEVSDLEDVIPIAD
jgi:phospholipid transport system transporter-binding protein